VLVTGLRAGQLIRFKHLFIPSMVEVDIPRVNVLNPFIPEGEVRELGLLSGEDILRHERYYFLTALMSSGDRVYLSTHRNEDDRPVLPSVFLDAVERAVRCDQLPPEDQARSRSGAQRLLGQAIAGNEVQLSSRPFGSDIDASCLAINVEEFKRDGPYRTEYDGMLSGDEVLADVAGFHSDRTYSASQVNMFSNCPFRFYLSYHMRLRPDRDDDEASPLNYGNAVHTVLQRFYTERCSAGRAKLSEAEREHAIERVREIAKEEAAKGTSVSWQTYMNHFVGVGHPGVASMFIDFELKDKLPSLSPRWIELCYGPHALEGGDPTSVPDPVEIPLDDDGSRKMKMECRIDRVDSDNRGNFFVLDYKTGSPKGKAVAANDLQIPLYILAMEAAVPGSRGIGGGFFYLGGKKNTKIVPTVRDRDYSEMMARLGKIYKSEWGRDSLDALRTQSLGAWLDAMSRGRFNLSMSGTVRPGTDCGPRCEFYGACRFDKGRAIEIGLGNNEIEEADE
jgi:RecB family exonuclease